MKRVLIVAYYFPPMGLAGVQRSVKFVKYLPEFGWEPVVLTVRDVLYYASDKSLLDEIEHCKIIRTGSLDPLRTFRNIAKPKSSIKCASFECRTLSFMQKLNSLVSSWFFVPDTKLPWIPFAVAKAVKYIKKQKIDLIFTTSPPHSSHLTGLILKSCLGLPWIADFRENWMFETYERQPTVLHRELNRWMLKSVLKGADKVIAVSDSYTSDLKKRSNRVDNDFITIFNGYDIDDFTGFTVRSQDKFTISYCGTLSQIRNPEVFLRGAAHALKKRPDMKSRFLIRLIGSEYGISIRKIIHNIGLEKNVEVTGYVSHKKCIQFLMDSDMLLLFISGDSSPGMVAGKVFEYLASGKPVFAAIPLGESEEILQKHSKCLIIDPDDENGMAAGIVLWYDLWKQDKLKSDFPRWQKIKCYDRKIQTQILAKVFDDAILKWRNS